MYHINKEITGNGENLNLKNTAKHYYKKFDILGNSKQETREGYNLLNIEDYASTTGAIINSITSEVIDVTSPTGLSYESTLYFENIKLEAGKTYTIQRIITTKSGTKSNSTGQIELYLGGTWKKVILSASSTKNTFTVDETSTYRIRLYMAPANTSDAFTITVSNFMIYEGTEEKPYEQYGASPSIEYESPIESVGDNINLLGIQDGSWTENGLTINVKDDEININGTVTASSNVFFTLRESLKLNGKYSFQAGNNIALTNGEYFRLYTGTTGFEVLVAFGALTSLNVKSENINISGTADRLAIRVNAGTVFNNVTFKPKLEKGTKATPYSSYGQGSVEVKNVNKNILKLYDIAETTKNGLTYSCINGKIKINGTATALTNIWFNDLDIKMNVGEYTLSSNTNLQGKGSVALKDLNGNIVQTNLNAHAKITLNKNTTATQFLLQIASGATFTNFEMEIQLEKGSTATDYVPHQSQTKALYTQQPFRAIGDVRDRFVKQNGVWNEEHSIYEEILNGTEEWKKTTAYDGYYRYMAKLTNCYGQNNSVVGMNTHFTQRINQGHGGYEYLYIQGTEDRGNVYIQVKDITTLDDFKTWLSENNVEVIYQLATPELIECTPEQVEQLEYFEKEAYSYDETTNIYSADEVSPYFEVTAYQRISEEFKTRLKEGKITRGYLKVLANDIYPEIIIDENNYLKDLKIEELRYIPDEGFIGGTVAKRVSGNFNNVDNSFDIQDREVEVYLGVELEDETTEYIKYGTYIVQRPEDDQVNDNTSFEALDYMVKFNQEYKDRITYPCTLKQLLDDIVDQAGVNSKVATFANSEFVVENNQFEQGTTLRDVLKAIAQVAFNWTRIDQDNNLVMDFEMKNTVDEELGPDDYFEFKKTDEYGPINTIILRNSQVEGENVTIKDDELINTPKGYNLINAKYDVDIRANDPYTIKVEPNTYYLLTLKQICIALGTSTRSQHWYKIFDKDGNILKQTNIIPFDFTEVNEIKSGKQSLLMPENADYIIIDLGSFNSSASNTLRHLEAQFVKGKEEKPYQPFVSTGEIELVIADNPFAYTELKRKQLIEAGRRLFGLRYTPMAVDMLGLMYLNAKDRISVENLNGEKFNTYLLDHTIDYTGIVLDSMQSQAKTKTETKYQYISSLAQGLSHVEIKVDKANKKIESIVQTQEDVSEKVAKTVARIEVVYALSDSPTTEPTNGWSTTAPEWTAGKYMWQKTITTYANGTTAETAATNISGAKGAPGQNGVGIIQTNITYQKSTSGTTVPTGTWQTTIPEVNEDGYLWTRTEFIYSDGSKKYAYNVGKKGAAGIGVKSLVDQYYLSTSNTEQTGGEWTETQPEWQDKTYIWTRTKINWTDNSITYTDPVLANTLNDINSNIVVLRELSSSQIVENGKIITRIEETTKKLNNDYSTTEQVDSKIDGLEDKYETLVKRFVDIEASNKEYAIKINAIDNNGVDKIKTLMGYTFNDEGLNIDRPGADTATLVNEKGVEVSDKTGASSTPLLYAGYVEEGNDKFPNYEGQTIVATSNLIVKNFLVIGSNSRFQDYINPVLGGQGTGAYDI